MPTLTVLKGVEPGRVYRLPVRPSIVGRQDNCEVAIDDPRASRQHACFRLHGDHWQVKDLDTENGTFVDGTKISGWTVLRDGCKLRVGHTLMRFDDDPVSGAGAAGAVAAHPVAPVSPAPRPSPRPATPLRDTPPPLPPLEPASALQSRPAQDPKRAFPEIPGCDLDRIVGRGATGTVYHGRQIALGREVAVKVLDPGLATQPQQVARFVQEAKSAALLSHPNVVPVIDVGEHRGVHYFLMEFMRGGTLQDRLDAAGGAGLPWREAVRIASAAAHGLGYIHKKGLVHRDVKPANVLLGESGEVKLGDLGTMVRVDDGASQRIGTPNFMSPEQAMRRPVTRASDVYSLGATLYYALSGQRPHGGRDVREIVANVAANAPAPLDVVRPGLPREVVAVVTAMMAREEAMRPTDATKVAERLALALEEVQAVRDERRNTQRTRREVSGWATGLIVLAVLGLVLLLLREQIAQAYRDVTGAPPPVDAGGPASPANGPAAPRGTPAAGARNAQSAPSGTNPTNATEYLVSLRQREALLGPMTTANAGQYRDIAAEYARVAARFPSEDPSVPIARDRSRELVALTASTTGGDPAYGEAAEAWATRAIAAAAPDRDAFLPPLELGGLRERLDAVLATETKRLRAGQVRTALDAVASWAASTAAAAERHRQKSGVVTDTVASARSWIVQSAHVSLTKLHADLAFDVALLRAQAPSLAGIAAPRGGRPDDVGAAFDAAIARASRISRLAMTYPGRDRIARRADVLAAQQRAWAAVEAASRPPADAVAPDAWRDAAAKSIRTAWPSLAAEHHWGAATLLLELGWTDEVEELVAAEPALATARARYLRTEIAARKEFARADGGADPAWRLAALRSWVRDHGATDASMSLAAQAKGIDLIAEHSAFSVRERDRYIERFGAEPSATEPAPPK